MIDMDDTPKGDIHGLAITLTVLGGAIFVGWLGVLTWVGLVQW